MQTPLSAPWGVPKKTSRGLTVKKVGFLTGLGTSYISVPVLG